MPPGTFIRTPEYRARMSTVMKGKRNNRKTEFSKGTQAWRLREDTANHGHARRKQKSPTYISWQAMWERCTNPRGCRWEHYGARGITVCERWGSFENFLADMGERPPDMTLDRYPSKDGNYEPGNVRWAIAREQNLNTRRNRLLTHNGITLTFTEWAERLGLPRTTLGKRLDSGWTLDRALVSANG
jgi:hypothetical protein